MTTIPFSKYHGTGNDFVLVDNRPLFFPKDDQAFIALLCNRRFGIGADGLILIENAAGFDFRMVYFNADGRTGTLCGNGGRCAVAFAHQLGVLQDHLCHFVAVDGAHSAKRLDSNHIELLLAPVEGVESSPDYFLLNTGSPHYVIFVEDLNDINARENGRLIRYSDRFRNEGVNVNFVEEEPQGLCVYTYERGVEDETLSCGTGVTASALAHHLRRNDHQLGEASIQVRTKGGPLKVAFRYEGDGRFSNVRLTGPALAVFEGNYLMP